MKEISSYEIGGSAARHLSDLTSISNDLHRTAAWLVHLRDAKPDEILADALFTASLISYRRCFISGVRNGLGRHHILAIGNNAEKLHDYLIDQASKLIAHSVNPFEVELVPENRTVS
jgi:hypothetical protein